jgi:hypothetical protein
MKLSKDGLFAHLGYVPHEGQVLVHRSKASRRVLACGSRWGKTTCAAMEIVAAMLAPRSESLGWCVAPTYETAELIFGLVVRTMHERFAHRVLEYEPRDHRLIVLNLSGGRSELRSKSCEDPNSLVGTGLDYVVIDEAARLAPRIWEGHLSQRLIDRNGTALLVSTPRGANWFYKAWKLGQKGRDVRFESWSSPSWINPHISRDLIEDERRTLPQDAFEQEYGAVFLGAECDACDTCHGPRFGAMGIVVLEGHDEPLRCPECNDYVHDSGETACALDGDGRRIPTRVIVLEPTPEAVLPP